MKVENQLTSEQLMTNEKSIQKLTSERDSFKEDSYSSSTEIEWVRTEKNELDKAVKKLTKEGAARDKHVKKLEAKIEAFEKWTADLVAELE